MWTCKVQNTNMWKKHFALWLNLAKNTNNYMLPSKQGLSKACLRLTINRTIIQCKHHNSAVNELLQALVAVISINEGKKKWGRELPHSVICAGGYNTDKALCCATRTQLALCLLPTAVITQSTNMHTSTQKYQSFSPGSKVLLRNRTAESEYCFLIDRVSVCSKDVCHVWCYLLLLPLYPY